MTLAELLDEITVCDVSDLREASGDSHTPDDDWYAVAMPEGAVAYFMHEEDAFGFRLAVVNALLNAGHLAERYRAGFGGSDSRRV